MKFGAIGAGAVALAFGREALARGHSRRVAACSRPGVRSPVATSSNSAITNTGGA